MRLLSALAVGAALLVPALARADDGGTTVGGEVPSTLSLGLEATAGGVVATVTTTDAPAELSVLHGTGTFSASVGVAGLVTPDPVFGLVLERWDDVLAARATTIRLRPRGTVPALAYVTLTAAAP